MKDIFGDIQIMVDALKPIVIVSVVLAIMVRLLNGIRLYAPKREHLQADPTVEEVEALREIWEARQQRERAWKLKIASKKFHAISRKARQGRIG